VRELIKPELTSQEVQETLESESFNTWQSK